MASQRSPLPALLLAVGLSGAACGGATHATTQAAEVGAFCAGIAAIRCSDGLVCVDDPRDDCEAQHGADCGGICVRPEDVPPHVGQ